VEKCNLKCVYYFHEFVAKILENSVVKNPFDRIYLISDISLVNYIITRRVVTTESGF
jgi:hypothetical protein